MTCCKCCCAASLLHALTLPALAFVAHVCVCRVASHRCRLRFPAAMRPVCGCCWAREQMLIDPTMWVRGCGQGCHPCMPHLPACCTLAALPLLLSLLPACCCPGHVRVCEGGSKPLHTAACHGHAPCMELLLLAGRSDSTVHSMWLGPGTGAAMHRGGTCAAQAAQLTRITPLAMPLMPTALHCLAL
jgi:hypothetical protein